MLKKIYGSLASLNLGIYLTAGVSLMLAVGSFTSGASESGGINDLPLVVWLREAPIANSWWLWSAIGLLALLAVCTVVCSIESLRNKFGNGNFLLVIAPQVMHAGFLLIMLAHLLSASGGFKHVMQVTEGSSIGFPDGSIVKIGSISATSGPMGMMSDFGAELRYEVDGTATSRVISPNHPLFHKGVGIYVKDVAMLPAPAALVEIHKEPGAGFALAGIVLFTLGNLVLLGGRRGR